MIGDLPLGGNFPIRIQSMLTIPTLDTKNAVNQAIKIFDYGADYVRITAPKMEDAQNLKNMMRDLLE